MFRKLSCLIIGIKIMTIQELWLLKSQWITNENNLFRKEDKLYLYWSYGS